MSQIENRSTHLASINIWNEEPTYQFWVENALDALEYEDDDKDAAIYNLSKRLEDYYRYDNNPLADYTMVYSDLLGWALACVDWYEIAKDFVENVLE